MSVEIIQKDASDAVAANIYEVHVSGKLLSEDYEVFGPSLERYIEKHGKVRILLVLQDFHGWTAGALWEDIKFDLKHFNDLERLAIVGGSKWEKGMAVFCKPFTTAKVKFFDDTKEAEGRAWLYGPTA